LISGYRPLEVAQITTELTIETGCFRAEAVCGQVPDAHTDEEYPHRRGSNKFRKLGFIEYNGGLKVNNSLLSVVLRD